MRRSIAITLCFLAVSIYAQPESQIIASQQAQNKVNAISFPVCGSNASVSKKIYTFGNSITDGAHTPDFVGWRWGAYSFWNYTKCPGWSFLGSIVKGVPILPTPYTNAITGQNTSDEMNTQVPAMKTLLAQNANANSFVIAAFPAYNDLQHCFALGSTYSNLLNCFAQITATSTASDVFIFTEVNFTGDANNFAAIAATETAAVNYMIGLGYKFHAIALTAAEIASIPATSIGAGACGTALYVPTSAGHDILGQIIAGHVYSYYFPYAKTKSTEYIVAAIRARTN